MNTLTPPLTALDLKRQLQSLAGKALEQDFSIALWRMPLSNEINFLVSETCEGIHEFSIEESKPGFIVAPFSKTEKKVFLAADHHLIFRGSEVIVKRGHFSSLSNSPTGKPAKFYYNHEPLKDETLQGEESGVHYKRLVSDCIFHIRNGKFEKVVPTRRKRINFPVEKDLISFFCDLCDQYSNAMVSLVSTPVSGTWIGATPEILLSIDSNKIFRTVALAGTQPFDPNTTADKVSWTQKEIEEQALVERYIISCFKKIRLREFEEAGPKTFRAGNLLHLRSDFSVNMNEVRYPNLGTVMLNLMHPTSAVCGMPLEPATDYLLRQEGYNREFYTGFLGPVQLEQETALFVNLRCMKWGNQEAWLYAGAGVTADSIPELEFRESEMKMETLYRLIMK
jgi:isochorismate synthase